MNLIINADDFGLTLGVSKGIITGIKEGIITDTSAMVNSKDFEESILFAKEAGIETMGVHLNITALRPVSKIEEVKSIVDSNGFFYKNPNIIPTPYNYIEIEKELNEQIKKFLKTGLGLDHLDVHHGFNTIDKKIFEIILDLAEKYKIPLRRSTDKFENIKKKAVMMTQYFNKEFYSENANEDALKDILNKYKDSKCTLEIMTHPGFVDEDLKNISSYNINRKKELEVLTSDEIKKILINNDIKLINYKLLSKL